MKSSLDVALFSSVLALLANQASAQLPIEYWEHGPSSPCLPFDPQNSIAWPTDAQYGTPAGFGRTVVCDLDGDQAADGVVLADGVAVVLWKVYVHDELQRIEFETKPAPVDVTDVAVLPGYSPDGRDALVMSDERGLYLVSYANGSFGDPVVLASTLTFARPIHVDDLDDDEELDDVLALGADRRSVYQSLHDEGVFSTSLVLVEPYNTFDVVAVNWDQDELGVRELAAVTTRGLIAHDFAGTLLGGVVHHASSGCITRLRTGGFVGGEIVAWTRPTVGGPSQLVLKSATYTEGPVDLTFDVCGTLSDIHPSAILAGRYDDDGNDELLLVHEAAPTAFVLANLGPAQPPAPGQPVGPHFDPEQPLAYDVLALTELSGAAGGIGIPAFTQVDGVDSDDLVFPVSSTSGVEVFLFYPFVRALLGSGITSADILMDRTEFGPDPIGSLNDNELRLAFQVPNRYLDYTHIEVIVWEQPDAPGFVLPVALEHRRHELLLEVEELPRRWITVMPAFPDSDSGEGICWNELPSEPKPNFYTEFRFAKHLGGDSYLKSPIYTGGFTLQDCDGTTTYNYLVTRGIPGTSFVLYEDTGLRAGQPEMIDRNQLGLYIPMSSQPPFEEGVPTTVPHIADGSFAHPFAVE